MYNYVLQGYPLLPYGTSCTLPTYPPCYPPGYPIGLNSPYAIYPIALAAPTHCIAPAMNSPYSKLHPDIDGENPYPSISWDITKPPPSAYSRSAYQAFIKPDYNSSAVHPICTNMRINCPSLGEHMARWGPVEVFNPRGIKVEDVINAIYLFFHKSLTSLEWHHILNDAQQHLARHSFHSRIQQDHDNYWKGAIRIDLASNGSHFGGLSLVSCVPGHSLEANLKLIP